MSRAVGRPAEVTLARLGKAISSIRASMTAFNSPHDDGRVTAVLLHLQHAFEMLTFRSGLGFCTRWG
jgi:hypothetical protein